MTAETARACAASMPASAPLQERAGVRARRRAGRAQVIRDFMPDQHRELFAKLPLLLVGSLDAQRRPWASILAGRPGFIDSPDPRTLAIRAHPGYGDPLGANLARRRAGRPARHPARDAPAQPHERHGRRARRRTASPSRVDQSFGNCPQYIQARAPRFVADPATAAAPRAVHRKARCSRRAAPRAGAPAPTRSSSPAPRPAPRRRRRREGVDVSHRGGKPGFVRVADEDGAHRPDARPTSSATSSSTRSATSRSIRAPASLFIDFATGDLLSLTGAAEVVWDGPEVAAFAGAERLLRVRVAEGVFIENALPLRWSEPEFAPQLMRTGSWGWV